jgi:hypothetical protein
MMCKPLYRGCFRRTEGVFNRVFHSFLTPGCGFASSRRDDRRKDMDAKKVKKAATKIAKAAQKAAAPKIKQLKKTARSVAKDALSASAKKLKKASKAI